MNSSPMPATIALFASAPLRQTFVYLGMPYGGAIHADCRDGYRAESHEAAIKNFVARVRAGPGICPSRPLG